MCCSGALGIEDQLLSSCNKLHLTSRPQRLLMYAFLRNDNDPSVFKFAPSSVLDGASSTAKPNCIRGFPQLCQSLSLPICHSAANTGLVAPPNTGKGRTFLSSNVKFGQLMVQQQSQCSEPRDGRCTSVCMHAGLPSNEGDAITCTGPAAAAGMLQHTCTQQRLC